jgi:uncharacterized protein
MANENHGRFIWHELMTSNPAAAGGFYEQVVGWTRSKSELAGMDYTMFMDGEIPRAGLMQTTPDAAAMGAPPAWVGYTEVDDIDATAAKVTSLGGKTLVDVMDVPGVGRFAVFADPQGAVFAAITSERAPAPESDPRALDFSWHELSTTDWKAAADFYRAIFGWEKKSEMDMGPHGTYFMFGRDRFTYGGMMNRGAGVDMPPAWLHYVRVADTADAAAKRAQSGGGKVIVGPMEVPGGDRVAVIIDPQGAGFGVHSKP